MSEASKKDQPARRSKIDCPPLFVPLGILVIATGLIRVLDLDLRTAAVFYSVDGGWSWDSKWFIQWLYRYGTYPAIGAASIGGVLWVASAFRRDLVRHRGLAMFLALVMAIGPGLIVNAVFKENFGRPRPRDVEKFGGTKTFLPVWVPDFTQKEKSFPSGHASMGFFWLCLGVYFWERNRRWAWGFLTFGLLYGGAMGFGRIVQGGHWLSDVLWAAGFVYLTSWILYRTLGLSPAYSPGQPASDANDS